MKVYNSQRFVTLNHFIPSVGHDAARWVLLSHVICACDLATHAFHGAA
jgi:hypothetical protein